MSGMTYGPTAGQTVKEALAAASAQLHDRKSSSPRLDAELLLAEALGVRREALYAAPERVVSEAEGERFDAFIKRRSGREPVAYILGRKAFRTIELQVNEDTLIPRPDTELLVEVALAELERIDKPQPMVMDLGTGSGAIALALATEYPRARIVASDVMPRTLEMARLNAKRLGLDDRVEFILSDLFRSMPSEARFDIIVSNPPYVTEAGMHRLAAEIRGYEPRAALLGGVHGMDYHEEIVPAAPQFLLPGGMLAIEINESKMMEMMQLYIATGRFEDIDIHNALSGQPRVISGREKR